MANRKAKGKSSTVSRPKAKSTSSPRSSFSRDSGKNMLPIAVIAASILIFAIYIAASGLGGVGQTQGVNAASTGNSTVAPPMTGVEPFDVGKVDESKAQLITFKLSELSGTDCSQTIIGELKKLKGIGKVRADYSNMLFEVQYDPSQATEAQMIEALNKGQHPGQVTTEKIAVK